jgi:hypothetical protein
MDKTSSSLLGTVMHTLLLPVKCRLSFFFGTRQPKYNSVDHALLLSNEHTVIRLEPRLKLEILKGLHGQMLCIEGLIY